MSEVAQSIDLDLARKLREDPEYRRAFFHAEEFAEIARQLIELRKRRELTQAQLAKRAGTAQPAISRYERADYQNWTISTLRSITDALDGRMRVVIEAAEDVLGEYERLAEFSDAGTEERGESALASIAEAQSAEARAKAQEIEENRTSAQPPKDWLSSVRPYDPQPPRGGRM